MVSCPDPEVWLGMIEPPSAELEAHLDRCPTCRELAAAVARLDMFGAAPPTAAGAPLVPELLPAGTKLGRYVVRGPIGVGAMGVVLEAFDPQLERVVALKLVRGLANDTAWGQRARARILDEARAMARVAHPNVVAIYELVEVGSNQLIAMEHVAGPDLAAWLRTDPPWHERLRVALEAGRGITAAHEAGIVHGDIKPQNVMIGADGRPRVTDFGLAALDHRSVSAGTPGYAAPELGTGTADARSDQYSYAVTVWQLLFDEPPGATRTNQHPIAAVLQRAMATRPNDRYGSMKRLLDAIRAAAQPKSRVWLPVVAIAALAAATAAATWIAVAPDERAPVATPVVAEDPEALAERALATLHDYFERGERSRARDYAAEAERVIARASRRPLRDGLLANLLGLLALEADQLDEAERAFRRSVAFAETLGAGHDLQLAIALHNLGTSLRRQRKLADATAAHERAIAVVEAAFGPDHPAQAGSRHELGELALALGRTDEALRHARRAVALYDRSSARDARSHLARFLLARVLWSNGERAQALALAATAQQGLLAIGSRDAALAARWLESRR